MAPPKTKTVTLTPEDVKTWICLYPLYLDKGKSERQGRRVSKSLAVENPNVLEINDSCKHLKLLSAIENKRHPRDFFSRGRVRVQLKKEDGTPCNPAIRTRKQLMIEVAKLVPSHVLRVQAERKKLEEEARGAVAAQKKKNKKKK